MENSGYLRFFPLICYQLEPSNMHYEASHDLYVPDIVFSDILLGRLLRSQGERSVLLTLVLKLGFG